MGQDAIALVAAHFLIESTAVRKGGQAASTRAGPDMCGTH